jgi:hypothetical protein
VVVDNHPGKLVRVTVSYFLQDAPARGSARFMLLNAGRLVLCGVGMYTPPGSPQKNFATVANKATVDTYGFNDMSGNITGAFLGK